MNTGKFILDIEDFLNPKNKQYEYHIGKSGILVKDPFNIVTTEILLTYQTAIDFKSLKSKHLLRIARSYKGNNYDEGSKVSAYRCKTICMHQPACVLNEINVSYNKVFGLYNYVHACIWRAQS